MLTLKNILDSLNPINPYFDRKFPGTHEEFLKKLESTTTLYIGNVDNLIKEEQIWFLLKKKNYSHIKRIIMGRNKINFLFCGFLFIEFKNRNDTIFYKNLLNNLKLNFKKIYCDFDYGFMDGREFGRGFAGGSFRKDSRKRVFKPERRFEIRNENQSERESGRYFKNKRSKYS